MSNFKKVLDVLKEGKILKDIYDLEESTFDKYVSELEKEGYSVKKIPNHYLNNSELGSGIVEVRKNGDIIGEANDETDAWAALIVKIKKVKFVTKYILNKAKYRG